MRIDVPYSFLVADGAHAWTCGQLALDPAGVVRFPGDLGAQGTTVATNLVEILERAELDPTAIGKLVLYHGPAGDEAYAALLDTFGAVAPDAVLVPIELPHFYYDGVELEVDLFWGDDELDWHCGSPGSNALLGMHQVGDPTDAPDPGAVLRGPRTLVHGFTVKGADTTSTVERVGSVVVVTRRAGRFGWVQARVEGARTGLVAQTEAIMARLDAHLPALGLAYTDVVKSTTHYVAGSSAEELHDNMAVRNRRYRAPGPASTGVPVHGFADPDCHIVIDLTLASR